MIDIDTNAANPYPLPLSGNAHLDMSAGEIAELIVSHRRYGLFRQEIVSGRCFFSPQACEIYNVPYTGEPANIAALVRRTHPDDIDLVARTFETASFHKTGFHLIHRYQREGGGYKFIRLVAKVRPGQVEGGELVGVVYEFYDHLKVAGLE